MTPKILFYVQHLQGVGHVFRATRIVRALVDRGFEVDIAFGGTPVPGLDVGAARLHFLPPVRAGAEVFNRLEDADGNPVGDAYKDRRRDALLELFERTAPDIVMTEAFPFGRRQMRFELMPLMEAAARRAPRPLVVASVRDILQRNRKPERDAEVVELVNGHFDHVLVHGDPALVRLEETFPHAGAIASKVVYTGIVAPEAPDASREGERFDVIVSVGGGAFGFDLLKAAVRAKPLTSLRDGCWLVLTGLRTSEAERAELEALNAHGVTFRDFAPDLPRLLAQAKLSVSRAGYNTVADVFACGCRAVVIPFTDGIETEQIRRAELLAARGLAQTLPPERETPPELAAAIERALQAPPPGPAALRLDGARSTAKILWRLAHGQPIDDLV